MRSAQHADRAVAAAQRSCQGGWRWAAFSPDGKYVSGATLCGTVVVWNARSGRRVSEFGSSVAISLMDFSPDDQHVAVGGQDGTITTWSVRTGRRAHVLVGPTGSIGVVSTARMARGSCRPASMGSHECGTPRLGVAARDAALAGGAAFSSDGTMVATTDQFGLVRFWQSCPACENAHALLAIA